VDPAVGLPAARAGDLLAKNGPNALPEEKAKSGWLRFLDEYRSYMQIILVVAAVVSLVIRQRHHHRHEHGHGYRARKDLRDAGRHGAGGIAAD
jgi:magnesium-transporting ATPase (P-type)